MKEVKKERRSGEEDAPFINTQITLLMTCRCTSTYLLTLQEVGLQPDTASPTLLPCPIREIMVIIPPCSST